MDSKEKPKARAITGEEYEIEYCKCGGTPSLATGDTECGGGFRNVRWECQGCKRKGEEHMSPLSALVAWNKEAKKND